MSVIKDLVPDLTNAYKQLESIKPWLQANKKPPEGGGEEQTPEQRQDLMVCGNVCFVFHVQLHALPIGGIKMNI